MLGAPGAKNHVSFWPLGAFGPAAVRVAIIVLVLILEGSILVRKRASKSDHHTTSITVSSPYLQSRETTKVPTPTAPPSPGATTILHSSKQDGVADLNRWRGQLVDHHHQIPLHSYSIEKDHSLGLFWENVLRDVSFTALINPLLRAEAKGVAGLGKAGNEGQGGSDKAGQQVPRETYMALSYACTLFLLTLSAPVILYGLHKLYSRIEVCFGCRKKPPKSKGHKKKKQIKLKRPQQQSNQSLLATISGQIAQATSKSDRSNNMNSMANYSAFQSSPPTQNHQNHRHQQQQQQQQQNLQSTISYLSSIVGGGEAGRFATNTTSTSQTNESFRTKTKAPSLKQLQPQATIGKYHLQQHQIEMLQKSLLSHNLALYLQQQQQQQHHHHHHHQQQLHQQQLHQQQQSLSNSLSHQEINNMNMNMNNTRSSGAVGNRYETSQQQINGCNFSLVKSNHSHGQYGPQNGLGNQMFYSGAGGVGLVMGAESSPNLDSGYLYQKPNTRHKTATHNHQQSSPNQQNPLMLDQAVKNNNNNTSSSTSSKSNGSSKKDSQTDSSLTPSSKTLMRQHDPNRTIRQQQQLQEHQRHLNRPVQINQSHSSMNLTGLNTCNQLLGGNNSKFEDEDCETSMNQHPSSEADNNNMSYSLLMQNLI